MKEDFKNDIFTPENLTGFLNVVIDEMLNIGQTENYHLMQIMRYGRNGC